MFAQCLHHHLAVRSGTQFDGILRPARCGAIGQHGDANAVRQPCRIAIGHLLPHHQLFIEYIQLGIENDCLHGVQPCGHSNTFIFVTRLAHPVDSTGPHDVGLGVIICKDGAAIPVTAKRLCREKACAGDACKGADLVALPAGPKALRRIVNHPQSLGSSKAVDGFVICRLAKQPDANNADNRDPCCPGSAQRRRQPCRVQIEAGGINLCKDRHGTQRRHHLGTGGKGKGGHDYALSRLQPLCQQC